MPAPQPYLTFDGNCAEAMRFYESTLGGKLESLMTNGESPMCDQMPPGSENRVMHARVILDGTRLMASDAMLGKPYEGMKNSRWRCPTRRPSRRSGCSTPWPRAAR